MATEPGGRRVSPRIDRLLLWGLIASVAAVFSLDPRLSVGPNVVREIYPGYRRPGAVDPTPPHLHDVALQIAAERGLPALTAWLWFVAAAAAGLWRRFRADRARYLAAAGLGALAAMLAAGMFEYNFGDSEFLFTFLVLLTLPWAANRDVADAAPAA